MAEIPHIKLRASKASMTLDQGEGTGTLERCQTTDHPRDFAQILRGGGSCKKEGRWWPDLNRLAMYEGGSPPKRVGTTF